MEFNRYITKTQVSEWIKCYINYEVPRKLIDALGNLNNRLSFKSGDYFICCLTPAEKSTLKTLNSVFFEVLNDQILKFDNFMSYQFEHSLKPNLFRFGFNLEQIKMANSGRIIVNTITVNLRKELERFYKELNKVKSYFNLNMQIYDRLLVNYRQSFGKYNMIDQTALDQSDTILRSSKVHSASKKFESYLKVSTDMYVESLHEEWEYKQAGDRLTNLLTADQFTKSESFYFGFFIGSICLCMVLCGALLLETNFFSYNPSDFVKFLVPIFRGTLALFVYMFFLGINVYGWETYGIDYKKLFGIEMNYSTSFQIMKRSFGFIAIWLIFFCYCAISSSDLFQTDNLFSSKLTMWIAPMPTVLFIMYMIFPLSNYFNFDGRIYVFGLIRDIIIQPFQKAPIAFRTSFALDQLYSFMILINDFIYTTCYINNIAEHGTIPNLCFKFQFRTKQFMVIFCICFWGNVVKITNLIKLILNKKEYTDPSKYRKDFSKSCKSLLKTLFVSSISVLGFYNYKDDVLHTTWICCVVMTTSWSAYDDIVHQWGFFQTKDWLRAKLVYPDKNVYYFGMFANVFLRLTWVLGLAPSIFNHPFLDNFFPLMTSMLECFRRMVWNFFVVEYQIVKSQEEVKFVTDYALPYPFEINMRDEGTRLLVNKQIEVYLKGAYLKQLSKEGQFDSKVMMVGNSGSLKLRESIEALGVLARTETEHRGDLKAYDVSVGLALELLMSEAVINLGKSNVILDVRMIDEMEIESYNQDKTKQQQSLFSELVNRNKAFLEINKEN